VELVISGSEAQVDRMLAQCRTGPRLAMVEDIEVMAGQWSGNGFSILPTD
jgi:acylphosphatase